MNTKIRKQIERRKRRIARRLDKNDNRGCDRPMMTASNIHYEIADRTRATANGGIGAMHLLVRKLGLDQAIDAALGLLKIHLPYHESDHVLNIAYNLLAGGTCLEHLELLRSDEAYLDALGARRIPDPTTAGDFCRRFDAAAIFRLQAVFNATRLKVWRQQPEAFFDGSRSRRRRHDGGNHAASANRAWTSTTKVSGGIILWFSRWPTRASRSSWSIAAAIGPATSKPPAISTGRSPSAAGQASRRFACAATPTSRRPSIWTAGTPETCGSSSASTPRRFSTRWRANCRKMPGKRWFAGRSTR